MPVTRNQRSGRIGFPVVVSLVVVAILGVFAAAQWSRRTPEIDAANLLLHTVERGSFEAFITEPGDVASSLNVDIRCRVRSRGTAGTAILKVVPEGTNVKKGDFLVQFDDSVLKNDLTEQKIVAANDKAMLIQVQSDLETARRTLREYQEGIFEQERQVIEGELFVAEEELRRTTAHLQFSRRLSAFGFITDVQLRADEFALEKAKKDVAAADRKLKVYDQFTRDKMVGQYEAEIEKQKANVEAAQYTLELSQQKLKEIEEQIGHCLVKAPSGGQVVHANERDRRSDTPMVIEEGTLIRDGQTVILLPDIEQMEVNVRINESHVNRVVVGQPAKIELEAAPDESLRGEVKEVAAYPFPLRWHGAPMEYGATIKIIDPPPTIRPGLRAKAMVYFEKHDDVLQVPLASVIEHGERHFCLVRRDGDWFTQPVQIGSNNNTVVIIQEGLQEGDRVALTPFQHIQRSDLPELAPASESDPRNAAKSSKSDPSTARP